MVDTKKQITQLWNEKHQPVAPAKSTPRWFVQDGVAVPGENKQQVWGDLFSGVRGGNKVEFYVTGKEYFEKVAAAIQGARKCIFIAGWQVNFDVQLTGDKKMLFQLLDKALDHADVFVMPWMSPKLGVDTGDFETMLVLHHLNAGRAGPHRAYCIPAVAQSDMAGALNIGFAHHQKLVVVDNRYAFMGGMDLAYGRNDDGALRLDSGGRRNNELYNSCIPPIHAVTHVEKVKYLTRAELIAACFEGKVAEAAQFVTSAPIKPLAVAQDAIGTVSDKVKDTHKEFTDWWNAIDLVPEFIRQLQDVPVDAAQGISRWAYGKLDSSLQGRLDRLNESGTANAVDTATIVVAWLNNVDLSGLPPQLLSKTGEIFEALTLSLLGLLTSGAANRKKPYENLRKLGLILPPANVVDPEKQPRLPWHDVHCRIEGPSASDLSNNFIRRWNGIAARYEKSSTNVVSSVNGVIKQIYDALGVPPAAFKPLKLQRIPAQHVPPQAAAAAAAKPGKSWVQVLRSAPRRLLNDEGQAIEPKEKPAAHAQNNCLKGMLKAIDGAQYFIYIEGQFYQTAHGEESPPASAAPSGPMGALTDIRMSPGYRKYARMLGIEGVPAGEIASKLIWSKIDDVRRDLKGGGADFMNDLMATIKGIAMAEVSRKLGPEQPALLNPVGQALVQRIERAVLDKTDFHVYMVLPMHPEGTLNTMNIMAQLHLTMQSLVFADDSLLNGVRRAVMVGEYVHEKKMDLASARKAAHELNPQGNGEDALSKAAGDRWTKYLTLLNLRNWAKLGGRPVTEQCYVHSKLLIADDRVAVLGSANINDRSMQGDRDSELAIIVNDDTKEQAYINGKDLVDVGAAIHDLRIRLWQKLFGLTDGAAHPASELAAVITRPGDPATWKAIQKVAMSNAAAYQVAFRFLPNPGTPDTPSSIWSTWDKNLGKLQYYMPFNERFWRDPEPRDESFTWDAKGKAPESTPIGIKGFIVALPITWTHQENNRSRMNLTLLANEAPNSTQNPEATRSALASTKDTKASPQESVV